MRVTCKPINVKACRRTFNPKNKTRQEFHSIIVGQFWRRPYIVIDNGEPRTYVRFNYKHYLLRNDNSTVLTSEDLSEFTDNPGRFGGEVEQ